MENQVSDMGVLICDKTRRFVASNSIPWLHGLCQQAIVGKRCTEVFERPLCRVCPFMAGSDSSEADGEDRVIACKDGQSRVFRHLPPIVVRSCSTGDTQVDARTDMVIHILKPDTEVQPSGNVPESESVGEKGGYGRLIGCHPKMQAVYRVIRQVALISVPVLICGETGTGKELVAREIHERSSRASSPLVAINCAAIPGSLMENELFGHERGAYTGATTPQKGCFERADVGTLLLDEIGDLPLEMQAKLLRVLDEGVVNRLLA